MNENKLKEIIECIEEQANAIKAKTEISDVEYGTLLGLAESLTIIQESLSEEVRIRIKFEYDIDRRFL